MSINVTVTGNPVSVRRGRMVTTGAPADEFGRRRLVRLEQVRQQSRDIADCVREKVRKEKRKQTGALEEEGREKLRRAQNRRLLELQTQYREGLSELGTGHREADEENERDRISIQKRETEHRDAIRRGREAAAALLPPKPPVSKKPPPVKKSVIQPSTLPTRHVSKKRRGANINIDVPGTDTEDSSSSSASDKTEEDESEDSSSSPRRAPVPPDPCLTPVEEEAPPPDRPVVNPVESDLKRFLQDLAGRPDVPQPDTRISDRIRRRELQPIEPEPVQNRCTYKKSGEDPLQKPVQDRCTCTKSTEGLFQKPVEEPVQNRCTYKKSSEEPLQKPVQDRCTCGKSTEGLFQKPVEEPVQNRCPCGKSTWEQFQKPVQNRCVCGKSSSEKPVEFRSKSIQVQEEKRPIDKPGEFRSKLVQVQEERLTGSTGNGRQCPCDGPVGVRSKSVQVRVEEDLPEVNAMASSEALKSVSGTSKVQFYDHASRTCAERHVSVDSYEHSGLLPPGGPLPQCCGPVDATKRAKDAAAADARFRSALERDRIGRDYEEMVRRLPLLEKRERVAGIGRGARQEAGGERERRRQNAMENEYVKNRRDAIVTLPKKGPAGPATWDEERPPTDVPKDSRINPEKEPETCTTNEEPKIFTANEVQEIVRAFTGRDVDERRRKLRQLLDGLKLQKDELVREIRKIPADDSVDELIRDLDSVDEGKKKKRSRNSRRSTCDSSSSSSSVEARAKGRKERRKESAKVLQTVSTQTSDRPVCKESHVPCDCSPELCEILIQIEGAEKPVQKPVEESVEKSFEKPSERPIRTRDVATGTDLSRRWQDSLTKCSFSTNSTSYRSPPDFGKFRRSRPIRSSLIPLVERLLAMSRTSVDELSVSQTSGVATPAESVVDVATNRPARSDGLEELVKFFATKSAELPQALAVSPDAAAPPAAPSTDSRESLMRQYADITESCSKRIEHLAEMIRKLRDEKEEMLGKGVGSESYSSSGDEDEMFRKMTEIDQNLVRKLNDAKDTRRHAVDTVKKMVDPDQSSNAELLSRLERLHEPASSAFVPFLSDIPKLPKFEPIDDVGNQQQQQQQHRRPPPSKGLNRISANDDKVPLVPHELSTIPEADSRAGRSLEEEAGPDKAGPDKAATSTSSDDLEDVLRDLGMEWAIPTLQKTKEAMEMASSSGSRSRSGGATSDQQKTGFASLLTNSSSASTESSKPPPRTSTPLTTSLSPSMAFSDSSSISYVKRPSNDS